MTRFCVALACASLLAVAGCTSSTRSTVVQHYTLGEAAAAMPHANHAGASSQRILQITRISVPSWLAGTGMYYRLAYRHDDRLAAYGYSDWAAPPATLFEPLIEHAIVAGGGWRAVTGPRDPAHADVSLHLRLDDFSQTFTTTQQSHGVIDATATLIDDASNRVIAQKHFHLDVVASSADAQGGVQALGKAGRQLAAHLARWLRTVAGNDLMR